MARTHSNIMGRRRERVTHAQYPGIYVPRCRHFNSEEEPEWLYSDRPTCRRCQNALAKDRRELAEAEARRSNPKSQAR